MTSPPKISPVLKHQIATIEAELLAFYRISPEHSVVDHLMPLATLQEYLSSEGRGEAEEFAQRAAVVVRTEGIQDAFIGVGFSDDIVAAIEKRPPVRSLSSTNLDAYCVLVEEVSHFNLITHRAASGRTVSRLELELQAEIDKVVLCLATLSKHYGRAPLGTLVYQLFDASTVDQNAGDGVYELANRIAGRFWHRLARRWRGQLPDEAAEMLSHTLRHLFRMSLSQKLNDMENSPRRIIKAVA